MTTTVSSVSELLSLAAKDLGTSEWHNVTQERVGLFADATNDHQWIHVDPLRAAEESLFGGPIAHGYLTLSLLSVMTLQVLEVENATMGVNYGLNKVRFPAPVPVESRVRLAASVRSVDKFDGGAQVVLAATIECDRSSKPVCVGEPIFRFYD